MSFILAFLQYHISSNISRLVHTRWCSRNWCRQVPVPMTRDPFIDMVCEYQCISKNSSFTFISKCPFNNESPLIQMMTRSRAFHSAAGYFTTAPNNELIRTDKPRVQNCWSMDILHTGLPSDMSENNRHKTSSVKKQYIRRLWLNKHW